MVRYTLSLERPSAHLIGVEIELATAGAGHLDIEFPAWSPGRYIIYDFARNVQEITAAGADGTALAVDREAKGTWRVLCAGHATIRISYRIFGDTLSGTFSQLDDRHAAINGSSVFAYVVGRADEPIELAVRTEGTWRVHTSMRRTGRGEKQRWHAANYDQLIDAPIEAGHPIERSFELDGVTYHVIIDLALPQGKPAPRLAERIERFVADTEKIVRAQTSAFGRPEFDAYYFLVNIDPYAANGDGMEHQESTRLVINASVMDDDVYDDLIGVTSHEFFHIWNVKRLRPSELGPFDYSREQHTTLLWFAEGFTQYYGHLMIRRAGVWNDRRFYKAMAREINAVEAAPGRFVRNLRASSFDTWFAVGPRNPGAAASNFKNTWVNYYHKGAVVAMLLDLEIRRRTGSRRSLDDVIRHLYRASYAEAPFGSYYLRGQGYTERDVLDAVEAVAGRSVRNMLQGLIEGVDDLDYAAALKPFGLDAVRDGAQRRNKRGSGERAAADGASDDRAGAPPHTGLILAERRERAFDPFVRIVNVLPGSPADACGMSAGDIVIAVDGERVEGRRWEDVIAARRSGDVLEIAMFRGSRLLTVQLTTESRDTRSITIEPRARQTPAQEKMRSGWLGA